MTSKALKVDLDFNYSTELEASLRGPCEEAFEFFAKHLPLPPTRLYCHFALTEEPCFEQYFGKYYRGFFSPDFVGMPDYLVNASIDFQGEIAFDQLLYLRYSTCLDITGCVLTVAHELQHLRQFGLSHKIWAANTVLYHNLKRTIGLDTTLRSIDIPIEKEANIVSKQVAEAICGVEAVKRFAEEQVQRFTELEKQFPTNDAESEKVRWDFFLKFPSSKQYNLLEATIPLINQFKPEIIAKNLGKRFKLNFLKEKWWS